MRTILSLLILLAANSASAQWQTTLPWGTHTFRVPIGSAPVKIYAAFGYTSVSDTAKPITIRQDSLRGNGFVPASFSPITKSFPRYSSAYSYTIVYNPHYEDTSSILTVATSEAYPYSVQSELVGITIIDTSNEYSLSRSDFGSLAANDATTGILKLFNQTPDTERMIFAFENGMDFSVLDPINLPTILAPGDSLPPIRVSYRANALRKISEDTLIVVVQRLRNGMDYSNPLTFRNYVIGRCNTSSYLSLSKSKFGFIHTGDSSVGYLKLYNPTRDTLHCYINVNASGDFLISELPNNRIVVRPYDSSEMLRIVMRATIDRKFFIDTLSLSFQWKAFDSAISNLEIDTIISGGCSDRRFQLDSLNKTIYSVVGRTVPGSILIRNLSNSKIEINRGLEAGINSGIDFFSIQGYSTITISPKDSVYDTIYCTPREWGVWEAQAVYKDWNDTLVDIESEVFDCVTINASDVQSDNTTDITQIYPNPSHGNFQIKTGSERSKFEIFDGVGRHVFSSTSGATEWKGRNNSGIPCASGDYFAIIIDGDKRSCYPITLNR